MSAPADVLQQPWQRRTVLRALVALVLGYALVAIGFIALHAGGSGPPTADLTLAGDRLALLRGEGERAGAAWLLRGPDASGSAVLAARVDPFAAASYDELQWRTSATDPNAPALAVVWQTREEPRRTFAKPLQRTGKTGRVRLDGDDGWSGTIVGVALVTRGAFAGEVRVESLTLRSPSAGRAWADLVDQWTRTVPFRGTTITFPFDEERDDALSLTVASALAVGLAAALLFAHARRRERALRFVELWPLALAAWLVLDLRWGINLAQELARTASRFAGKDAVERHRADVDGELFTLMQDVKAALPTPPARVFFLADSPQLRSRGSYFLLPHNVFHELDPQAHAPPPNTFKAGDFVVLFLYRGLAYDFAREVLVWPDGTTRPAAAVRAPGAGPVLLRMR